jgi:hypothetical protein
MSDMMLGSLCILAGAAGALIGVFLAAWWAGDL